MSCLMKNLKCSKNHCKIIIYSKEERKKNKIENFHEIFSYESIQLQRLIINLRIHVKLQLLVQIKQLFQLFGSSIKIRYLPTFSSILSHDVT